MPRGGHAAALLPDGHILVVGGWISSGRYTDAVEIFDSVTGDVREADPLPWAADALEATALADGRVLVTGGQVISGEATASAAVYDPGSGRWRAIQPMATPRLKHFAVLIEDGRVLVGGGSPDDQVLLASTEVFDPLTQTFIEGPQLLEARYKLPGGVVALPGGSVLVGGGGRTVELVDVAGGVSLQVDRLPDRASFATMNLLSGDFALILGGYDERIDLTGLRRLVRLPSQR